jgi:hypothetical protein
MNKKIAFFGGAGIGLLIGVLIGMTTSGIVGTIIGTLTTILLAFLNDKEETAKELKAIRIGAFGFFCVLGILGGLFLRVQNTFAPSPTSQVKMWMKDSLFTKEEAKVFYLYDRFGFLPEGYVKDTTKSATLELSQSTILFSKDITDADCDLLEAYDNFDIKNKLEAYAGVSAAWKNVVEQIRKTTSDEKEQEKLLKNLRNEVCKDE